MALRERRVANAGDWQEKGFWVDSLLEALEEVGSGRRLSDDKRSDFNELMSTLKKASELGQPELLNEIKSGRGLQALCGEAPSPDMDGATRTVTRLREDWSSLIGIADKLATQGHDISEDEESRMREFLVHWSSYLLGLSYEIVGSSFERTVVPLI